MSYEWAVEGADIVLHTSYIIWVSRSDRDGQTVSAEVDAGVVADVERAGFATEVGVGADDGII